MHEPFPHAHHMEKITFPQLPNGREITHMGNYTVATKTVSRPQTPS